ncbi:MAG: hypothetical protein KME16_11465 [Scytolyngbya sp. HA4215-MV1]|jgi:hypothetical protein|nr:hypothetical protein [Scytolyngbya sp. HA4215-MV1]
MVILYSSRLSFSGTVGYVVDMLWVFLKALLSKAFKNTHNTFEALPTVLGDF